MKKFLLLVVILAGGLWWYVRVHGFSARAEPAPFEEFVAKRLRRLSVAARERDMKNPLPLNDATLADGRAHFADHCASCHGNDGRGETEIGKGLYPKAPNMRDPDTQDLTDGEIFYIIKNGVRLTGMPAWGEDTSEDDIASWHLVSFIRHLPWITPKELEEMKTMNPVNPMEMKEEKENDSFLEGDDSPSPSPQRKPATKHGH